MSAPDDTAIIVFDGVCVLCSGWVRFLLRHDRPGRFRFAAMQSAQGRALLSRHGLSPDDPASFLLLDDAGAWMDMVAVGRVFSALGGRWRVLAAMLRLVPRPLGDALYRTLARHRYRWFGRHPLCLLPSPEHAPRFLT